MTEHEDLKIAIEELRIEDLKIAMEELRIEMKANTELIDRVCNTLEQNNEKIKEIFQNVEKLRKKNA